MTPLTVTVSILETVDARTTTGGTATPTGDNALLTGCAAVANGVSNLPLAAVVMGGVIRTAKNANSPTNEYVMTRAVRMVNPSASV
jgi:hypothetical protein